MKREEQIKKAARDAATVVTDVAENGSRYCDIIPEWQRFFEQGAKWADANPAPLSPEEHFGSERLGQMQNLWATAYEHVVEAIVENHSPASIAKIFFELGFRAADEHPFIRKERQNVD